MKYLATVVEIFYYCKFHQLYIKFQLKAWFGIFSKNIRQTFLNFSITVYLYLKPRQSIALQLRCFFMK